MYVVYVFETNDLLLFLEENLKSINTNFPETKTYINSVFIKFLNADEDLSNKNIILEFAQAKNNYNFNKFQEIGDWILYGLSIFPKYFKNASEEYYITIGQNSYYKCFKMLNNKWPLFEELSDNLELIIKNIKSNNNFY